MIRPAPSRRSTIRATFRPSSRIPYYRTRRRYRALPGTSTEIRFIPSGVQGATVTGADSGADAVLIGSGNSIIYDNAHTLHGTMSAKFDAPTSPQACLQWTATWGSHSRAMHSFYMWLDAYPPSDTRLANFAINDGLGALVAGMEISTTGVLTQKYGDGPPSTGDSSDPIPLGQWIRVEVDIIASTTTTGSYITRIYYDKDSATPDDTFGVTGVSTGTAVIDLVRSPFDSPDLGPMWIAGYAISSTFNPSQFLTGLDKSVNAGSASITMAAQTPSRTISSNILAGSAALTLSSLAPSRSVKVSPGVAPIVALARDPVTGTQSLSCANLSATLIPDTLSAIITLGDECTAAITPDVLTASIGVDEYFADVGICGRS